jgi:uncharacterized protein YebE (UPF0316 family)
MADYLLADPVWLPIIIFLARITDVSAGTLRVICIVRGHRVLAVLLSFVEILVWIFAVSVVLTHLDRIVNVVAYAGGFATGNALGMWIEGRLALGTQAVSFISRGPGQAVAERLRFAEHCVTTLTGRGRDGPVAICHAILPRKFTPIAIRMAREIDPDVVVTVEDVRTTNAARPMRYAAGKAPSAWRRLTQRYVLGGSHSRSAAHRTDEDAPEPPADKTGRVSRAA